MMCVFRCSTAPDIGCLGPESLSAKERWVRLQRVCNAAIYLYDIVKSRFISAVLVHSIKPRQGETVGSHNHRSTSAQQFWPWSARPPASGIPTTNQTPCGGQEAIGVHGSSCGANDGRKVWVRTSLAVSLAVSRILITIYENLKMTE